MTGRTEVSDALDLAADHHLQVLCETGLLDGVERDRPVRYRATAGGVALFTYLSRLPAT
jgi:hypothetical protein